jgi:uncharacterized protein YggE
MDNEPRTLVVTGEGVAHGTPDRCLIHLALNVMADTAANALDQLADLAIRAVRDLRDSGVEPTDIQTTNLSLHDYRERERVTARVASYSITVKTRSVEEAGPILATLSEVAGDSLQVHRLQLAVSDPEVLQISARKDAVLDATARAHQLAEAAGLSLGHILEISEGQHERGPRAVRRSAAVGLSIGGAASIPIEAGEVTSTVAVTVTYAIED